MLSYKSFLKKIYKLHAKGIKLNLSRIEGALEAYGHPENSFSSILVAGTNGKGSTTAFLEKILLMHGYRTARLTSPHIQDYRERIVINGKKIDKQELILVYEELKPLISKYSLTFFEITTLLAFVLFKRNRVEWAVLEIGLGGRLDATNTVYPKACIITGIGLDHTKSLGNSLQKIAGEKAGIIKSSAPVFLGRMQSKIKKIFINKAKLMKAKVHPLVENISHRIKDISKQGTQFTFRFNKGKLQRVNLKMIGFHQVSNALLALLCFHTLFPKKEIMKSLKALEETVWHARFELIKNNPQVWLDVGHNLQGVTKTLASIDRVFKNEKLYILFAALRDKKIEKMAIHLAKRAEFLALAPPESDRAPQQKRLETISQNVPSNSAAYRSVTEAIINLLRLYKQKQLPIFIIGSLFTAAEAYRFFNIFLED